MAIGLVNNNADAISRRMFLGWVFWNGGSNWARIFDLGAGQGRYMFMTPKSSTGVVQACIGRGRTTPTVVVVHPYGQIRQVRWFVRMEFFMLDTVSTVDLVSP